MQMAIAAAVTHLTYTKSRLTKAIDAITTIGESKL
jgi:hypothetical protein